MIRDGETEITTLFETIFLHTNNINYHITNLLWNIPTEQTIKTYTILMITLHDKYNNW